jgi:iron complex transport system substrate-binding protein
MLQTAPARSPLAAVPLAALLLVACVFGAATAVRAAEPPDDPTPPALRVVSMNPSLTAILVAIDASEVLVGVEEYSLRLHPELAELPVVGGLFNPSLEAVIALAPDLVVLVPSAQQRDFRGRLEALGIEVLALPNISVTEILASIETLGARVGRGAQARARVRAIRAAFSEVAAASAARPRVATVVVLQRDPLFVVGAGSFVDEMLVAAGATNLAAEWPEAYPRVAVEWLIAAAPAAILDASDDPVVPARYWQRWPSIPAVANGRALFLPATATFPGPYIDRALRALALQLAGAMAPAASGSAR